MNLSDHDRAALKETAIRTDERIVAAAASSVIASRISPAERAG